MVILNWFDGQNGAKRIWLREVVEECLQNKREIEKNDEKIPPTKEKREKEHQRQSHLLNIIHPTIVFSFTPFLLEATKITLKDNSHLLKIPNPT